MTKVFIAHTFSKGMFPAITAVMVDGSLLLSQHRLTEIGTVWVEDVARLVAVVAAGQSATITQKRAFGDLRVSFAEKSVLLYQSNTHDTCMCERDRVDDFMAFLTSAVTPPTESFPDHVPDQYSPQKVADQLLDMFGADLVTKVGTRG